MERGGDRAGESAVVILTIGHSTLPIESFVERLKAHGVEQLADVRRFQKSRRQPHFNHDALAQELPRHGIAYADFSGLGGMRRARQDSINTAWQNASFRGYADYMLTPAFEEGLRALLSSAEKDQTAIMCAEAVPWRCHRSLIADALVARAIPVEHIMSATSRKPHTLTPFAKIDGSTVTYPGLI